jgi:hypothetical protein
MVWTPIGHYPLRHHWRDVALSLWRKRVNKIKWRYAPFSLAIGEPIWAHAPCRGNPASLAVSKAYIMSYKKVGAIRFVKLGRFGFSFWVAKKPAHTVTWRTIRQDARTARDNRPALISTLNQVNAMLALANVTAGLVVFGVI